MIYTLTPTTVEVLKNFATINNEVVLREGSTQRVLNPQRNFIADVELTTPIPRECALTQLSRLLGVIDTAKSTSLPDIQFNDDHLLVVHEHGTVRLPYASMEAVTVPPIQQYYMDKEVANFQLPQSLWDKIKKTAAILETGVLQLSVKDGILNVQLVDEKLKTKGPGATYMMPQTNVVDTTSNVWAIRLDALKLMQGSYTVSMGHVRSSTQKQGTASVFGVFFTLNDADKKVSYLTSGSVVTAR